MILGIDASNIRTGGGVTHLVNLLRGADPLAHGYSQVIVWSGQATLGLIEDRPWLLKSRQPLLDKSLPSRIFWQRFRLDSLARQAGCNVLFVPGGSYTGDFYPMVTMSQNLLPFEWRELWRYGCSYTSLRLMLLRLTQSRTFRQADGLIFLTRYACDIVMREIKTTAGKTTIIPHGIDERFICPPREQLSIDRYSIDRPFRILYVSIIDVYKHQWHVAEAVAQLRASGLPVVLDLAGPAYPPAFARLKKTIDKIDPSREFIRYAGNVPHTELHTYYAEANLFLFASSCETFGQILTEAMSAGLPIACSNRGPMPEVLGDGGMYFDPENHDDIARALRELIDSPDLRAKLAKSSFGRAQTFSWQRCTSETFRFLAEVTRSKPTSILATAQN
ncbi:MAG: glycosyltransferase family 4 protein [Nitrospirae bacterium]|nr:glycosyltransferase family 4 protein [Nitrospirota bacterium]MDE3040388.1 glycosyltransferase family 4 protein [Nitrospirota bacterium]